MALAVAAVIITVWHWPFPVQLKHVAGHFFLSSDKMAGQRRRKEYVPRQAQEDPETITNNDEDNRREFTLTNYTQ